MRIYSYANTMVVESARTAELLNFRDNSRSKVGVSILAVVAPFCHVV